MIPPVKTWKLYGRLRKLLLITVFSFMIWTLLYIPMGLILNLDEQRWVTWFVVGTPYDIIAEIIGAYLILWFDQAFLKRKKHQNPIGIG